MLGLGMSDSLIAFHHSASGSELSKVARALWNEQTGKGVLALIRTPGPHLTP